MDNQPQPDDSINALRRAIWDSNEILVTASTVSPLRKNTITLNRTKLVAEEKSGLSNVAVMSVRIEDVLNVNGAVGPVLGFVKIHTRFTPPDKPYSVGPFRRKDVLNLKRIIQGYVIALEKKIDLNPVPTNELIAMLYQLGEDDDSIQ